MTDYGHDLLFGAFLPPLAEQAEAVVALARAADELGLDLLGIQDHPYQPRFLDTWTLLSSLAAQTAHIRLFPDVANLPLRPPAVLARSAASLDRLSGGRVELGLGAGAFWDAIAANGGPRRSAGESVEALAEAIAVIRALWSSGGGVHLEGKHYRLDGARPGPPPAHPIGIWVGAYGPRMLRLTGRLADGWVPSAAYAPPPELPAKTRLLDAAAERAGRDPAAIRRVYNVDGDFAGRGGFLQGPASVWVEQLTALALEQGLSGFLLSVSPAAGDDLRRFAEEVAPAVGEAVARERRPAPPGGAAAVSLPPSGSASGQAPEPDAAPAQAAQAARGHAGQELLLRIHDHLRQELAQVREALAQLEDGRRDLASVRSLLGRLTMRQNSCAVGAFCAGYCRLVGIHHTIEDRRLFPDLRNADGALAPVLARLMREHEEIAELLSEIDTALGAMAADAAGVAGVRRLLDRLAEQLLAHLAYEEAELLEPIGRHAIEI